MIVAVSTASPMIGLITLEARLILDRVDVKGFRRLKSVTTYVGRKTIALVGPNEAGKSSFLAALRLFENSEPVPPASFSRSLRALGRQPNEDVVVLWFALEELHTEAVTALPLADKPTHFRLHKKVGGEVAYSFHPTPTVRTSITSRAAEVLGAALESIRVFRGIDENNPDSQFEADADSISSALIGDAEFDGEAWDRVMNPMLAGTEDVGEDILAAMTPFNVWARPDVSVSTTLRSHLQIKAPAIAMFGDRERAIRADNPIDETDTQESIALANLLSVAGLALEQIRANRDDRAYVRQLLDDANDSLATFFSEHWRQEEIAVGFDLDGDNLRVMVKDLRKGSSGWLDITDRSDGLRVFVALATFLRRREDAIPPILLIDEAEQHLHWNAQSDLVRMLQNLERIQQVIYTTHSPGCLPADIGSGVRFVEPLDDGVSTIRHDFWSLQSGTHVGFNPLLMVMGAGAAAFSGLRSALLVEGATDMLLLPSLIKLATALQDLDYQVAPGIAVASKADMQRLDLAASRVAFLVDGDDAGREWEAQLTTAGVEESRIRQLPKGVALEDLLDRDFYLDAVEKFLPAEHRPDRNALATGPIKSALSAWAADVGAALPGPVAVAEEILGGHESRQHPIKLNPKTKKELHALHVWAKSVLAIPGA
jgi:hypothetical protein